MCTPPRRVTRPRVGLDAPGQHPEQARLAAAVAPHDPDPVALVEAERAPTRTRPSSGTRAATLSAQQMRHGLQPSQLRPIAGLDAARGAQGVGSFTAALPELRPVKASSSVLHAATRGRWAPEVVRGDLDRAPARVVELASRSMSHRKARRSVRWTSPSYSKATRSPACTPDQAAARRRSSVEHFVPDHRLRQPAPDEDEPSLGLRR